MADENPKPLIFKWASWPWATILIVLVQVYVFYQETHAMQWGIIDGLINDFAFFWPRFTANPWAEWPTLISGIFLHANWSHLIGNTVFFLIFASAVEQRVGSLAFVVLYFFWGVVADLTQGFFMPVDGSSIGASGAISGAAGAFFVLFPMMRSKWRIPAFILVGLWFGSQLQSGFRALMPDPFAHQFSAIAHWAHIGGFAAGAISMLPFLLRSEKA